MSFARVADKDDAIAASAHIRCSRFPAGTIDKLAVKNQYVELLVTGSARVSRNVFISPGPNDERPTTNDY